MKYLITESKLEESIVHYINELFDVNNIHWTNPLEQDDETGEEWDDDNRVIFYVGDYEGEDAFFQKLTFIRPCGTHYLRTKGGAKAILQSLRSLKYLYGSPSDAGDASPRGLNSSSLGYPAAG